MTLIGTIDEHGIGGYRSRCRSLARGQRVIHKKAQLEEKKNTLYKVLMQLEDS